MHRRFTDATIPMFALCLATSCVLRTPTLTARTSSFPAGLPSGPPSGPPSEPPADPATVPVDDSQVIDAGCSLTGEEIKGEPGTLHPLSCPAGCDKETRVYGTDVYASLSPVCIAAVHAGMISERGGQTTLVLGPARPAFRGSKRNSIESHDFASYRGSFRFHGAPVAPVAAPVAVAPVIIDAGCTLPANEIHGEPGSIHRVSCPGGCDPQRSPPLWGSNPFTGHSPICLAAMHAGLVGEHGGEFTLILEEGRPAYRGSKCNGVESADHGSFNVGFRLQR